MVATRTDIVIEDVVVARELTNRYPRDYLRLHVIKGRQNT